MLSAACSARQQLEEDCKHASVQPARLARYFDLPRPVTNYALRCCQHTMCFIWPGCCPLLQARKADAESAVVSARGAVEAGESREGGCTCEENEPNAP
jgi:hypothetical protein